MFYLNQEKFNHLAKFVRMICTLEFLKRSEGIDWIEYVSALTQVMLDVKKKGLEGWRTLGGGFSKLNFFLRCEIY